jgi:hypothetical protein
MPFIVVPVAAISTILPRSAVIGQDVYYSDPPSVPQAVAMLSHISTDIGHSGSCQEVTRTEVAVPAPHHFTIPLYNPPFSIEPEACFTPADPGQAVNGCIKSNGTIKIVNDPADCSSRETPISWLVN